MQIEIEYRFLVVRETGAGQARSHDHVQFDNPNFKLPVL